MFQPWYDVQELKEGYATYTQAFGAGKDRLLEANKYHSQLAMIQAAVDRVHEQVSEQVAQTQADNTEVQNSSTAPGRVHTPVEALAAMEEFKEAA